MAKYELSLTATYAADWGVVEAVRELFQNALDQETSQEDNTMFFTYNPETETLMVGNKRSVLEPKTLLLGSSTKREDVNTIGQFGEGYKLASLVLCRLGKKITFYNYGRKEIWRPRFVNSRRYGNEPILTFFTEKFFWTSPPDNDLTITVEGISPFEYKEIVASNLHLQEDLGETLVTSRGRILCDERYIGYLFVNGLLVKIDPEIKVGYDLKPGCIKLDRDRRMVATFDIIWQTSAMWSETQDKRIVELARKGAPDVRYVNIHTIGKPKEDVATVALDVFRQDHGIKAIPVGSQEDLEEVQKRYPDAKPIIVTDTYKKLVTSAPSYQVEMPEAEIVTLKQKFEAWYDTLYAECGGVIPQHLVERFADLLTELPE